MSTETANEAKTITADEIVKDIISYDDLYNTRKYLRGMYDSFVLYHDAIEREDRETMFNAWQLLDDALEQMEVYEQQHR